MRLPCTCNSAAAPTRRAKAASCSGLGMVASSYTPTFQFQLDTGRLMPEMSTHLSILPRDRSGWRQALWLFQPHGQLEGKRPADVFQKDPKAVIEAARSDFEINDERW